MSIEIRQIVKKFGDFNALKTVDLEIGSGELVALLGPSGSGKTTLLRIVAGLESADSGSVLFHGEDTQFQEIRDRQVGFVFQHYALFRHMTVFENIAFGLRVKSKKLRPSKEIIKQKVDELLKLVQLDRMATRYPHQLSGGQRQRIALARALAIEPKVLLLDEPFGALDAKVRKELRTWLRRLHDELHITSIFVTHDVEEALEVADRIVVMNEGKIEQIGTPDEVYHHPANPFVYNFLGNVNFFHCRFEDGKAYLADTPVELKGHLPDKNATVYIRPHLLDIERTHSEHSFRAKIKFINAAGPLVKIELQSESGQLIQVELPQEKYRALNFKKDEDVFVKTKEMKVFGEDYVI